MAAHEQHDPPYDDSAPGPLKRDAAVVAVVVSLLVVATFAGDPAGWLLDRSLQPGWGLVGKVMFLLAASHLVMIVFGARRSVDLKHELAGRRLAQARLLYRAEHDELTGLRNRSSYLATVEGHLVQGDPLAVVLVDLDRFKEVNDTLGHHVGDLVLQEIAQRMTQLVPESGLLARLGGDEFAVVLPHAGTGTVRSTVLAVLDAVRQPLQLHGYTLELDASIGVAAGPQHGRTGADLLRRADLAMYSAKAQQAGIVEFSAGLEVQDLARLTLNGELKRAVTGGQLHLLFQPKVGMDDGQVVGVEALVRWRHPSRGLLAPGAFLPFAEQTGIIRQLTDHIIDQALTACSHWKDQGLTLPVAVNLSPRSLLDNDLPRRVAQLLAGYGLPARCLELEVTEDAAMTNPGQAVRVLNRLAELGVTLSIDDFGTGRASLTYLSRLPIDALKIDRSFVQRLDSNAADRTIVRSTIGMAHDLGLSVVAEGVETDSAWPTLSGWGCDAVQGYWLSHPIAEDDVPAGVVDLTDRLAGHPCVPRPRRTAAR